MAGLTPEQIRYTHDTFGVNPDDYQPASAAPPGAPPGGAPDGAPGGPPGAPPGGGTPWSFSPLKPLAPSLALDPNYIVAGTEAHDWVQHYLTTNKIGVVQGSDILGAKGQLMFGGKATPSDTVIKTTLAASALGKYDHGDLSHRQVDEKLIARVITEMVGPGPADTPASPPAKKDDDDSAVETTVEVTNKDVQTNIQFTVKLLATKDDQTVVVLPDVEITLHLGKNASTSTVEAQLNLIKVKKDVSDKMQFNGHVIVKSIEFKTGVSAEAGMSDVALLQIQKSVEVKVKSELEFKVNKAFSFSVQGEVGRDGNVVVGPKLIFHF